VFVDVDACALPIRLVPRAAFWGPDAGIAAAAYAAEPHPDASTDSEDDTGDGDEDVDDDDDGDLNGDGDGTHGTYNTYGAYGGSDSAASASASAAAAGVAGGAVSKAPVGRRRFALVDELNRAVLDERTRAPLVYTARTPLLAARKAAYALRRRELAHGASALRPADPSDAERAALKRHLARLVAREEVTSAEARVYESVWAAETAAGAAARRSEAATTAAATAATAARRIGLVALGSARAPRVYEVTLRRERAPSAIMVRASSTLATCVRHVPRFARKRQRAS
jgi:hypothetical protein